MSDVRWPIALVVGLALLPAPAAALEPVPGGSVEGDLVTIYLRVVAQGHAAIASTPDGLECGIDVGYSNPLYWEALCDVPAGFHCADPTVTVTALAVSAASGMVRCAGPPFATCSPADFGDPATLVYGVCSASASGSSPGLMGCAGRAAIVNAYAEVKCVFRLVPA